MYSEHAPVTPGPGKPGNGLSTGTRYSVSPNTPGKQGTVTTPGRPITPGSPGSTATPGDSVGPVHTGQKAQLEKTDQSLDQSELSVLNSPVQLAHNVHEQPGDIPNLQTEHLLEHSQVCQDLTISDSPDIRSDDSTERLRTHLQDS